MKIAVSATGTSLDAAIDPRFGRAAYILIVDSGTCEMEVMDNTPNANAFKGAGIQAACAVNDRGATVLLTGYCGPNAFKTLSAAGIRICQNTEGTVKEAIALFNAGKLPFSDAPNAEAQGM